MPQTLPAAGFTTASFESLLASRSEPAWLVALRRAAWERFESLEMPSRRDEEWIRTDIRLLKLDKFGPEHFGSPQEAAAQAAAVPGLLSAGLELGGQHQTLNSRSTHTSLSPALEAQGVVFGSLDALVSDQRLGPIIKQYLYRAVDGSADKLAALHAACWSGGTLLYVPRGVVVEQPLHTLAQVTDQGIDFGRTLVILEEGAQATLLQETLGEDQLSLHNGAVELFVGPEATLRYVNLQNWGRGTWHFAHQHAHVDRDARLQWTIGALGARLAKVNQHVSLTGEHAWAQVNGVMFTEGKQHLAYHTLQHHRAANCRSDLLYKGALQDTSRLVWRGMIKVDPDAQRTDGYQRNDNLMLSDHARADSIPGLEIEADDVRCTHGSTTGRVDDSQVFYARCRGLTRKEAVRMIVAGFFQQVFDRITIETVREALGTAIGRRIREYD